MSSVNTIGRIGRISTSVSLSPIGSTEVPGETCQETRNGSLTLVTRLFRSVNKLTNTLHYTTLTLVRHQNVIYPPTEWGERIQNVIYLGQNWRGLGGRA